MKDYSLKPTEENAIELLRSDPLGRNKDVFRFVKLLDAIDDSCAIALNGDWGSGKTFFVKQVKMILDCKNPFSAQSDEKRETLNRLLPQDFSCDESYSTVYYDAWINDNHEDPILSLIYASISSNQSNFTAERQRSLFDTLGTIAEVMSGRNISNVLTAAKGTNRFEALKEADDIHDLVKNFIDSLIEEHGNRLVVFIDELDRCKPDYAVRLLERIKHYFDDSRITFVFSVSLSQLQWTVKGYYGADFDATRYLDKFFDLHISLPEVDYNRLIEQRINFGLSDHVFDNVCIQTARYFRFSLREVERYIRLIKIAAYAKAHSLDGGGFSEQKALEFSLLYVVPIAIGTQMHDLKVHADFIQGKNPETMTKILCQSGIEIHRGYLLQSNESFFEDEDRFTRNKSQITVSIGDRLNNVYNALFAETFGNEHRKVSIGSMSFTENTSRQIKEILSLLSPISDYYFE